MEALSISQSLVKRNQLQAVAKETYIRTVFSTHPYRMAYYMGTGIGKTKISIDAARWYIDTISPHGTDLIACHSISGRDKTWPTELAKWGDTHQITNATRVCYKSLPKFKGQHFRVVILDEAHKLTSTTSVFFQQNTVESVIVLTATEPRDTDKRAILNRLTGSNRFEYTNDQAIADGILNEYDVHVFKVKLEDTIACIPMSKGRMMTEKRAYLEYCSWLTETTKRHETSKDALINMMRFMGNTPTKTMAARYLSNKLRANNRRFLVFANSKEQAAQLSPYQYHSGTDDIDFERFCNLEINELVSINQIQEGANIEALDRGIVTQLNTNPLNMIQKIGRLLRKEVGTLSSMLLVVFEGTHDEDWCRKALAKTPKHKIHYHTLEKAAYYYQAA